MNPPPPPTDLHLGVLLVRFYKCDELLRHHEWSTRPQRGSSLPPSSVASAKKEIAKKEIESNDLDGGCDGDEQWRPWADIATPLLDVLLPAVSLLDRVLISSVCRSWHDFLASHPLFGRPQFPLLLFQNYDESVHDFYSLSDNSYHVLHLTNTGRRACIAASHGWLLFVDLHKMDGGHRAFFINPLSKACIDLPTCPEFFREVAISTAPTEHSSVAMGLALSRDYNWDIYYCHIKNETSCKTWDVRHEQFMLLSNIAVMDGKFYFLCKEGLAEIDFKRSNHQINWLKLNFEMLPISHDEVLEKDYRFHWLVESNGELLLVILLERGSECPSEKGTNHFYACIYRADFANKIWAEVESLCGRSLFLSKGSCFSLPRENAGGSVYYVGCAKCLWHEYRVYQASLNPRRWRGCIVMFRNAWPSIWFRPTPAI